jgi:hypothetical protein
MNRQIFFKNPFPALPEPRISGPASKRFTGRAG